MCGVRVGTALAIGWALFATSACGFLGLDGLTGGDAGHSYVASSSGGGDDGVAADGDDVSPEATSDVESVPDSSPDRTMGGDAGPTSTWCMKLSPAPAFCADYDEGQLLGAFAMGSVIQVPAPTVDNGGSVSLDMKNPSSPPASCAAAVDVLGDADVQARFENPVTITNTDSARLRFDMRIDADDPNQAYVADVFFNNGSNQEYVQLSISQNGGFIRWQGLLTSAKKTFAEPPVGVWTRDIEVTGNVKTGTLDLQIGGTPIASLTAALPFNTSDSSSFYLGLHCFQGSKRITFDNVVFTPGP
jgi:hypothetical protein